MKKELSKQIEKNLQDIPARTLQIERHPYEQKKNNLFTDSFQTSIKGKGKMIVYQVFPGIQLSLNYFRADQVSFRHEAHSHILEINHSHAGRIGWNFKDGTSAYLGEGDLAFHSMDYCADSVILLPLGYCEGITISVNLKELNAHPLPILKEAGVDTEKLHQNYCIPGKSMVITTSDNIDGIFCPLYHLPERFRVPYFQLKIQELLLYLSLDSTKQSDLASYGTSQTAIIREIHHQLTSHLDHRFTIGELSKQYLINTSSLKETFKGVYGLPVATYMKEYRIRKGMEFLRQTDCSIAGIAAKVGYETQGKFTKAFKDVTGITPSAYRKKYQEGGPGQS